MKYFLVTEDPIQKLYFFFTCNFYKRIRLNNGSDIAIKKKYCRQILVASLNIFKLHIYFERFGKCTYLLFKNKTRSGRFKSKLLLVNYLLSNLI